MTGIVVGLKKTDPGFSFELKALDELLDEEPLFSPSFLSFSRNLSLFFHSSWGELLHMSLPPSFVLKSVRTISRTSLGKKQGEDPAVRQGERDILRMVKDRSYSEAHIQKVLKARNLSARLTRMEEKGLIRIQIGIKRAAKRRKELYEPSSTQLEMDFVLDGSLHSIAQHISLAMEKGETSFYVLRGKGEKREAVYMELIRSALKRRKKVLFLLPEISLTEALVARLEKKLGIDAAVLHSRQTERKRELEWNRILRGEVPVVLGARSSLMAPVQDLGLIIVDEEQDDSYFQEENPVYDARTGARIRAEHSSAALVFGSKTPSVETYYKASQKKAVFALDENKGSQAVILVDMRREQSLISGKTAKAVKQKLKRGEKVLVFLNRLGYASYLVCSRCSHIPRCPHCGVSLAFHKKENKLVCHYCQFSRSLSRSCPVCQTGVFRKHGIGIEVVEEEFQRLFPGYRVSSFGSSAVKNKKEKETLLENFKKGLIDILIGTQLLAHHIDLPQVCLAVVLSPESLLALSDFQAAQKTFHYLNRLQRFVRNDPGSEFIVQTSLPGHHAIRCFSEGDYLSFYEEELEYRRLLGYPPFIHMAEVLLAAEDPRVLSKGSRQVFSILEGSGKVEVFGPAKIAWAKIRGRHKIQIIVKSDSKSRLDAAINEALQKTSVRKKVILHG